MKKTRHKQYKEQPQKKSEATSADIKTELFAVKLFGGQCNILKKKFVVICCFVFMSSKAEAKWLNGGVLIYKCSLFMSFAVFLWKLGSHTEKKTSISQNLGLLLKFQVNNLKLGLALLTDLKCQENNSRLTPIISFEILCY